MQVDGLALDQHGLESLDTEAVKGRGAVEQDGVLSNDLIEDIPDHRGWPQPSFGALIVVTSPRSSSLL